MNSYRKYTTCVKAQDFTPSPLGSAAVAATWLIVIVAIVSPMELLAVPWYLPIIIGAVLALIAASYWYLNGRLICLGTQFNCTDQNGNSVPLPDGQECAIGVIGAPGHKGIFQPRISGLNPSKFGDDDSTMDILLAPGPRTWDDPDFNNYWSQAQGYLVAPNTDILNVGLGYAQSGDDINNRKFLHCEFEGSGIRDFLDWMLEILAFLVAILLIEALVPGAAALLWLLGIIAGLLGLGALINLFTGWLDPGAPGDPSDLSPSPGNLQAGDIVLVTGDWIYDGGHPGWNEIHAVHYCQKISEIIQNPDKSWSWPTDIGNGMGLDTRDKVIFTRAQQCCAIRAATGAITGGSKTDPGNNWVIHPLVDGCKKPVIIV